ncbi:hypothetical protein GEMRC1_003308 [Eukaryota sp. GEM-RC1]
MFKNVHIITLMVAILMSIASIGGIFLDIYNDNRLVSSGWVGNDIVSLLCGVPLLLWSLSLMKKTSVRGTLAWLGMMYYVVYNYAFYLFGASFNSMFLVYVTLFTLSGAVLLMAIPQIRAEHISSCFTHGSHLKLISLMMFVVSVLLGLFHIIISADYIFSKKVPDIVITVGHVTNVIAALDLSMVVPVGLISSYLLWKRHPWGFVLSCLWNLKGAVYTLALSFASIFGYVYSEGDLFQLALWVPICISSTIAFVVLLTKMKPL